MIMQNKRRLSVVLIVALLLLIPFIAMQFTDQVNWSLFDFFVMGALLLGTGILIEFVIRKVKKIQYRIAICGALLAVLILIWMELAVGIFRTPFGGS
jgi:peptidoglycan/LPS O-acetylase OafA/YrhL